MHREVEQLPYLEIDHSTLEAPPPVASHWSVSTLVPGLHGKPSHKRFKDFTEAIRYAQKRAWAGPRVLPEKRGGKHFFILGYSIDVPEGFVAYRVFRGMMGLRQAPSALPPPPRPRPQKKTIMPLSVKTARGYSVRREFILVQRLEGYLYSGKPHWVLEPALSFEIPDPEAVREEYKRARLSRGNR